MPLSVDVKLPKSQTPVFPNRCVACGIESPGASHRVSTNAIGWWTLMLWSFGRRHTVEVPACESCRDRMRRQRWVRVAVSAVVIVVGIIVAGSLLQWYRGPMKRWLMLGIVIICLLPLIAWEMVFPPPFDMTVYSDSVEYEFRDPDYAAEFAALNRTAAEE